jgi:RHS repeat-associated protein
VVRSTLDHATHKTQRVIDFAGLAEVRPDDAPGGIFLSRLSVSNSTAVEEARSLATGERLAARSGYLHKDLRGSVVAQSTFEKKSAVELVAGTDYEPWGDKLGVGTLAAPVHAFLDREPDPGLGYYQLGARVYDPKLRRWISPDPLLLALPELDTGSAAQLNLYAYGLNNPVRYVDPNGMDGIPIVVPNPVFMEAAALVAVGTYAVAKIYENREAIAKAADRAAGAVADAAVAVIQAVPQEPWREARQGRANAELMRSATEAPTGQKAAARQATAKGATAEPSAAATPKAPGGQTTTKGPTVGSTAASAAKPDAQRSPTPRTSSATLRRQWEKSTGQRWPKDEATGRNQDVSHKRPLADGGSNDPPNLEPKPHDEHVRLHRDAGDFRRWGARACKNE